MTSRKNKIHYPAPDEAIVVVTQNKNSPEITHTGLFHSVGRIRWMGNQESDKVYVKIYQPGLPEKLNQIPLENVTAINQPTLVRPASVPKLAREVVVR